MEASSTASGSCTASTSAARCAGRRGGRARWRAHAPRATRSRGPRCQRGPVSSRTRASPRSGSCSTRSVATTSATSGRCSSPPSPTTSTGTPALAQRLLDRRELGPLPAQHGDRRAVLARPAAPTSLGEVGHLVVDGRVPGHPDGAVGASVGRTQRSHRHPAVLDQRLGQRVGDVEHDPRVAPRGGQAVDPGGGAGRVAEGVAEGVEVVGAGAAPAVDRLVRVADRGDGVAVAEQARSSASWACEVSWYSSRSTTAYWPRSAAATSGSRGEPRRDRDLVAEVEHAEVALAGEVGVQQRDQRPPGPQRAQHLADVGLRRGPTAAPPLASLGRPVSAASTSSTRPTTSSGSSRCSAHWPASDSTAPTTVSSA